MIDSYDGTLNVWTKIPIPTLNDTSVRRCDVVVGVSSDVTTRAVALSDVIIVVVDDVIVDDVIVHDVIVVLVIAGSLPWRPLHPVFLLESATRVGEPRGHLNNRPINYR